MDTQRGACESCGACTQHLFLTESPRDVMLKPSGAIQQIASAFTSPQPLIHFVIKNLRPDERRTTVRPLYQLRFIRPNLTDCARSAPPGKGNFSLRNASYGFSSSNAQIFPLRGPGGALRAARYAGRATRAGVLRTDQATDTGGQIPLMKPSARAEVWVFLDTWFLVATICFF